MPQVPTWRLVALRALYLLMAVGLGLVIWPSLLSARGATPNSTSVVQALLGALGLLAVLGLRYPLQMLPVLIFELLWKLVWVTLIALPAWRQGQLGEYGTATLYECLPVFVLFPLVLPWRYLAARFLFAVADPWRQPGGKPQENAA